MKNTLLLIGVIIAGAVLGALLATVANGSDAFGWLAYSKGISLSPSTLDLVICKITFGIDFSMSIAQVICIIIGIAFYPKLKKIIG